MNTVGGSSVGGSSTKFIVVTIGNNLSWLPHIESLYKNLESAAGIIFKDMRNVTNLYMLIKTVYNKVPYSLTKTSGYPLEILIHYILTNRRIVPAADL